jgi:hypothetical protein
VLCAAAGAEGHAWSEGEKEKERKVVVWGTGRERAASVPVNIKRARREGESESKLNERSIERRLGERGELTTSGMVNHRVSQKKSWMGGRRGEGSGQRVRFALARYWFLFGSVTFVIILNPQSINQVMNLVS